LSRNTGEAEVEVEPGAAGVMVEEGSEVVVEALPVVVEAVIPAEARLVEGLLGEGALLAEGEGQPAVRLGPLERP